LTFLLKREFTQLNLNRSVRRSAFLILDVDFANVKSFWLILPFAFIFKPRELHTQGFTLLKLAVHGYYF